jgi:lysophospholipid acyltransferase (LPLAT)-like uncharacterized protein
VSHQTTSYQASWNWKDKILLFIVPRVYYFVLRFLSLTIPKKVLFPERADQFWAKDQRIITAFWHQRLLLMPFVPHQGRVAMMSGLHRDSEFIVRTVRRFGIEFSRGSTTTRALSALRGMIRLYRSGANLAVTPDGPQGPKYVAQMGIIELARQTGAPIVPLTYSASHKKLFNSWDNFLVPLPFSKVVYLWGEPLSVPRDIDKEGLEEKRLLLQERLCKITEEADRLFQK